MKIYAPDYYGDFKCIANKCEHSCCIGWEIDIDDETYKYYEELQGDFGEKVRSGISADGGTPHFALSHDERCPFLNKNNLCDIITELGEGALCGICADHPRYRSFFSSRIEIGLGLCCEEAARLILTHREKVKLVLLDDNDEKDKCDEEDERFFALRARLLDAAQNRGKKLDERIGEILKLCSAAMPQKNPSEWAEVYSSLEILDPSWTEEVEKLKKLNSLPKISEEWDIPMEQLFVYFILRHTADGLYDGLLCERTAFAVHCTQFIYALFIAHGKRDMAGLIEAARRYSAEIEYCAENIDALIEMVELEF